MKKIRLWWKQFKCLHVWDETDVVGLEYGHGYQYLYVCKKCDKKIRRFEDEAPISYLE